jgi:hypothetical protein
MTTPRLPSPLKFGLASLALALLSACAPLEAPPRLEITPFPTVTPGHVLVGELLPVGAVVLPAEGAPATPVNIAAQTTPAPDFGACPPRADVPLEASAPQTLDVVIEESTRYLANGGDPGTLLETLREAWRVIPPAAPARGDIDYSGEGVAELLLPLAAADGQAALVVLGCRAGSAAVLYEARSDTATPPQILAFADVNRDRRNDLLFSAPTCPPERESDAACDYRTQLLTWSAQRSRFVELLPADVLSAQPPTVSDFDNDEVSEVIVQLTRTGTAQTGPLRTGTHIYDWNGTQYVLSIVELDAPRFKIQALHEGDRALLRGDSASAKSIYQTAFDDPDLRFWFDDEPDILQSYTLYRLLQTQVLTLDPAQLTTIGEIQRLYPDLNTAPVYAVLAQAFYETFTSQSNVGSACAAVGAIIAGRPDALAQLNRYGDRNPTYTETDLCPF